MFDGIIGNDKIKNQLKQAVNLNKTSHSYLFLGISGIGKKMIAKEFAKMILCENEEKYCNKVSHVWSLIQIIIRIFR